jgi:hypothetical protein
MPQEDTFIAEDYWSLVLKIWSRSEMRLVDNEKSRKYYSLEVELNT